MTSVPSWWMQGPFGTAHTLFHRRRWRCVHNRDAKMKVYCCQKHTYVGSEERTGEVCNIISSLFVLKLCTLIYQSFICSAHGGVPPPPPPLLSPLLSLLLCCHRRLAIYNGFEFV